MQIDLRGISQRWQRSGRRLGQDERGTTAVEFGMVATPFFMMLFGIISVGFYFFTTFTLENAVENAARLIRTGQVQTVPNNAGVMTYPASMTGCTSSTALATCFKTQVCNYLPSPMFDCAGKVRVNVTSYSDFSSVPVPSCTTSGGALITDATAAANFSAGTASQVVLVSACYEWDLAKAMPFLKLTKTQASNNTLIQASTVFMTEPYN